MQRTSPRRVLVVEDDPATLEYTEMVLQNSGFSVDKATTGEQALAAIVAHPVDVILLDWRLPDIDGLTLCKQLRDDLGITTPVMVLTADRTAALLEKVHAAGATDYLHKPFVPSALIDRMNAMM